MYEYPYIGWIATGTVFFLTTFVQISKININPWSALFGIIGRMINKDIKDELSVIHSKLDANTQLQIQQKRYEIIKFSMECRADVHHFKCEFDRIIEVHGEYLGLLDVVGKENGVIDEEFKYIQEVYQERLRLNDFVYEKGDR